LHEFGHWRQQQLLKRAWFGDGVDIQFVYCTLHARLRISEKILRSSLELCEKSGKWSEAVQKIKKISRHFDALKLKNGFISIKNVSTLPALEKIMTSEKLRQKLANMAFPPKIQNELPEATRKALEKRGAIVPVDDDINKVARERLEAIWKQWSAIFIDLPKATSQNMGDLISNINNFGLNFVALFGGQEVTPYIHVLCGHTEMLIKEVDNLGQFEQQGLERTVGIHKFSAHVATANGGGNIEESLRPYLFPKQIMLRFFRICYYSTLYEPDQLKPVEEREKKTYAVIQNKKRSLEEAEPEQGQVQVIPTPEDEEEEDYDNTEY
jgi:hypothetical protein